MSGIKASEVKKRLVAAEAAPTADAKGKLFEDLLVYLFESVPGTMVEKNSTTFFKAQQIDVAVSHNGVFTGVPSPFLVECKNYEDHVDSKAVGYFLFTAISRSSPLAVIVAANGLTGDPDQLTHAHSLAVAASAIPCKLIVITRADLLGLKSNDDFVELIARRFVKAFANAGLGA